MNKMKPTPATPEELEQIQDKLTRENGYSSDRIVIMKEDIPLLMKHDIYFTDWEWRSKLHAIDAEPNIQDMYMYWPHRNWEYVMTTKGRSNPLYQVMKKWKENPPDDLVLEEFRNLLKDPQQFEDGYGRKTRGKCFILEAAIVQIMDNGPGYVDPEFIELLIHFGGHTEHSQEYLTELYEMMKDCEKQVKRFQEVLSKYKP